MVEETYTLQALKKPTSLPDDCSNICLHHLSGDRLIIGHEQGCYITNFEEGDITPLKEFDGLEVTSICASENNKSLIYIACERSVRFYDERVSLDSPQFTFPEHKDEINNITVNSQNHLATCDDAGELKVYDVANNSVFRDLRKKHTNIASSISFMTSRADDVISGGLDSKVMVVDYKRVKSVQIINTQDLLMELDGDDSVYMFNPPLVYSLGVSDDGKVACAGFANGILQVFKILKGNKVLLPYFAITQHSSLGVSDVCFPKHMEGDSSYIMASGGNDGIVNVWALPVDTKKKKKQPPVVNRMCEDEETEDMIAASVDTNSKVNFLQDAWISDNRLVFVGDQTSEIKYLKV